MPDPISVAAPPTSRLHLMCSSRTPAALENVRSILGRGGNPRERSVDGLTPLHVAAACDNVAVCQLLLHFGADLTAKDDLGRTPITVAIGNAKEFLSRYLEKDRRARRGLLRRLFICHAGIIRPDPPPSSFVRGLKNRVRRSVAVLMRKEFKSVSECSTAIEIPSDVLDSLKVNDAVGKDPKPRRRAKTPDILERTPIAPKSSARRSRTPDFEPGSRPKPTPRAQKPPPVPRLVQPQETPKRAKPVAAPRRVPARQMVEPSAPPMTPEPIRHKLPKVEEKPVDVDTSAYLTAEESFDVQEMEERLQRLQISTAKVPEHVDEGKLRRIKRLKDTELRAELKKHGIHAGPICSRTRKMYEKKLLAASESHQAVVQGTVKYSKQLELAFGGGFDEKPGHKLDETIRAEFQNKGVTAFVYLLLDPRLLGDEKKPSLKLFVEAIFYIGKGTKARPLAHLIDAKRLRDAKSPKIDSSDKFKRINGIWNSGQGVALLEISHTISNEEAFVREAAFIEAIRIENLSNIKGGEWHGSSRQWDAVTRATLGVYLLEQARSVFHTMPVRRVVPETLPESIYPNVTTRRR